MTIGFYTLAIAAALLLISLLQDCKVSVTGCITLGIFSVGILLAGIFPTDVPVEPPTARGLVHGFAALIALFSLGISMMAWGNVFKKNGSWKSMSKLFIFYGVVSLVQLGAFNHLYLMRDC